jgi:hypothetical protein
MVALVIASYIAIGVAFVLALGESAQRGDHQNQTAYAQWRAEQ